MRNKARRDDLYAVLLLSVLWALFFWRALTPNSADQASLAEGDFSAQFYAFSAYQAARLQDGALPLWNPYANGGHPFLADTQSAVFYPPRLLAIYLSPLFGGWSYGALQLEGIAHFWLSSVLMYIFMRRTSGSVTAGLVAALTFTYSGYLTGYPVLQLAILEAAVWLPLILLGIFQATRQPDKTVGPCMMLAGVGLGLCLLAGHAQTALFVVYVALAYLAYRLHQDNPTTWRRFAGRFIRAAGVMGGIGAGLYAVQLVPGWEYVRQSTRAGMGFDAKAGGFPIQDIAQFLVPDVVSYWSPLYVGLAGLALAGLAVWRRYPGARFWGGVTLAALGFSFGGRTIIYPAAYTLLPGVSMFRGQERAAFVVAFSLSVLAGLGTAALHTQTLSRRAARRFLTVLTGAGLLIFALTAALFVSWLGPNWSTDITSLGATSLATVTAVLTLSAFAWRLRTNDAKLKWWPVLLIALIVFDLFSVNIGRSFEPGPASARPQLSTLTEQTVFDDEAGPFRVDGRDGLGGNYGTMLGIADIEGISPLRLAQHDAMLHLPEPLRWRLMGVRYVFSAREELPVASEIIANTWDGKENRNIYLHRLSEAYPMAWLSTAQPSDWPEPFAPLKNSRVEFVEYAPEHIAVTVRAPSDAYLFFSEYAYPGWEATLDNAPRDILTAWGELRAVYVPQGTHIIEMSYRPLSVRIGAYVSMITLLAVAVVTLHTWLRRKRGLT